MKLELALPGRSHHSGHEPARIDDGVVPPIP